MVIWLTRNFLVDQDLSGEEFQTRWKVFYWICGAGLGPLNFSVEVTHGVVWCRHVDHLKPLQESPSVGSTPNNIQ